MKYPIVIVTTFTLIAAFVLSGCDRPSNQTENAETSAIEANRDMEIADREVESELRIYRSEKENRLMNYNRTIEEIKQDINNEPDRDVKARHESKLDEYEADYRELKREMDDYQASGRENWEDFKDSFSSKMDELGNSLEDFFSTSGTTSSRN